jgi:formylglycine-generating enzyme required for sulfatase activity
MALSMQKLIVIAVLTVGLLALSHGETSIKKAAQVGEIEIQTAIRLKPQLQTVAAAENQSAARDSVARHQAETAVTLLRRGQANIVWPLLRHSSDPSLRTFLIHGLGRMRAGPAVIIRRLDAERDVSARRALILSLGEFTGEQLSASQRLSLISKLLRWYRDDPDAGIHAAIDWLLRYGKQGETPRKLDWQQTDKLDVIDRELAGRPVGRRNWYVTKQGHTMIIIRGPVEFVMGAPEYEPGRTPDETQHRVRIPRSLSIANKEVTVAQFQRFLQANPTLEQRYQDPTKNPTRGSRVMQTFSPDDECPQIAMTWYEAAQYCNWLSKEEGIPESEWCYPTDLNQIRDGMELPRDYLRRTGYRMLTEAEWELASRADATTSRFYGYSEELLREYAWYSRNPPKSKSDPPDPNDPQRTWPVGQLKPNDFGLFDIYGNVWEWVQDRWQKYRSDNAVRGDMEDPVLKVVDAQARTRRGGSFSYEAAVMRSAHRGSPNAYFPMQRRDNVGFRVARTYR